MGLFSIPTDAEVASQLGPVLGSWEPIPFKEISGYVHPPNTGEEGCLTGVVVIGVFAAGVAITIAVAVGTGIPYSGVLTAVALLTLLFVFQARFGPRQYATMRLGVFENGLRFGHSLVRFDELKVITLGAPKTRLEANVTRHTPTLAKIGKGIESPAARRMREMKDRSRKLALNFEMCDGKNILWVSVLAAFSKESLVEFYKLLDERIPDKFQGLQLTEGPQA